jgi:catechol 2,3-dioxygenase-like lactoylglutathione lyase family enzyme
MGIGLTKIKHVKVPVSDLQRSVSRYQSLLDLELHTEFVEEGIVRGASLLDRDGGYEIALRDKAVCAGTISEGFDFFALSAPSRALQDDVAARCDRLGVIHTGILHVPDMGAGMDITDPDGTVVRIVWTNPDRPSFLGVESDEYGAMQAYFTRAADRPAETCATTLR